jgi:hypothetical protein
MNRFLSKKVRSRFHKRAEANLPPKYISLFFSSIVPAVARHGIGVLHWGFSHFVAANTHTKPPMGQLRFSVPLADQVSREAIETAHVCGRDRLPWVTRISFETDQLIAERVEGESGTFHILWTVPDRGELLLCTATLMERDAPYQLQLELARGTLNRLRNLIADLQAAGLGSVDVAAADLAEAIRCFIRAVVTQSTPEQSAGWANHSIRSALTAIDIVTASMCERVQQVRQRQAQKVVPLFAGRLGDAVPEGVAGRAFLAAFNSAIVPFSWGKIEADEGRQNWQPSDAQVQWCQANGLRIGGGPLLELRKSSLPSWIYLWEGDFENLLMVAGDFIRSVVNRYKGKVNFWNAAGRIVTGEALSLDEEQKLRLVVRAIEVIRQTDPGMPVVVSFDQPWAEYMMRRDSDLPPQSFADALVRSDLGIAGVGLEINLGINAAATLPRDLVEFNLQIDRWCSMGLPLLISLAVPSAGGGFSSERQQRWFEEYLPVLTARPNVQAIFWSQLNDADADDFPHTGLVEESGRVKPAFATIAMLRKQFSV